MAFERDGQEGGVLHGNDGQECRDPPENDGQECPSYERICASCQTRFAAEDEIDKLCPECRERQTAIWVVVVFVILFICFVVLPLVVQGFNPFRS